MDDIATQSAQFSSHQFKAPFMGHFPINMVSGLPVQLLKKQCHRPCEFASHHPFFCSVNPHTSSTLCVEKNISKAQISELLSSFLKLTALDFVSRWASSLETHWTPAVAGKV